MPSRDVSMSQPPTSPREVVSESQPRHHVDDCLEHMSQVCQHWKTDARGRRILSGSLYNRLLLRRISIHVTRWCVRRGVSADAATMAMAAAGMIGCVLSVPHGIWMTVLAGISFFLFDLLDAVDGEIARWTGTSTTRGLFLDQLSHLVVDYPTRGLAAAHLFVWTSDPVFLLLAIVSVGSSLLGRTVSEIGKRINAETRLKQSELRSSANQTTAAPSRWIERAKRWKSMFTATHPLVKARVVQILTLTGILLSYAGMPQLLVVLSWFYAIYLTVWVLLEIPYYCRIAVVNETHTKSVDSNYRWPI